MGNALWLHPYFSDLATISASTTSGSLAASNMQTAEPTQKWTSTAGSGSYIDLDFGASGAIAATAVALIGVNLGSSDTMSVFASNTSNASARAGAALAGTSPWGSSGKSTESGWPYHIAFQKWSNSTSYRYWSITFPSVAGSSVSVGRLMLGAHLQTTLNFDVDGIGIEHVSADMRDRTDYNKAMLARRGNVARRLGIQYTHTSKAEALRGFLRLSRLRGNGGDLLFTVDPDETTYFPEYTGQFTMEQLMMPSVPAFDASGVQYWSVRTSLLEVV